MYCFPLERESEWAKETKEVVEGVKISSGKNKSRDWWIDRLGEREREWERKRERVTIVTKRRNHTKWNKNKFYIKNVQLQVLWLFIISNMCIMGIIQKSCDSPKSSSTLNEKITFILKLIYAANDWHYYQTIPLKTLFLVDERNHENFFLSRKHKSWIPD